MTKLHPISTPLRTHLEVIERAKVIGQSNGLARVVIAAAEEDDVLAALYACWKEGIADAVLVGNPDNIIKALEIAKVPGETFEIVKSPDDETSAKYAAEMAGSGNADVVMKGFLKTSVLLKTLLRHQYGLRDRELVSHSAVMYASRYGKLLNVTDGGTLITPSFEQKMIALANGYRVLRAIGVSRPKIAVLAPWNEVRSNVPETKMALEVVNMARAHWADYLDIDGPMSLESAVNSQIANDEELKSPVTGDADMILVHRIEEANILAKTLIQFSGAIFMGVISGAKVPISLVSRSDTMMNKMSSIALAVCLADYLKCNFEVLPEIGVS
ncbi:MAG: phosphate acyltransferase [Candidatus Electryonea clarkiae]|nr:phosphate acyltransferase [Candidatus Electryonea clarkiae]MDP8288552.1 phosphate acyltransferase [Candidatus Electryonea clarkiae]